VIPEIATRVAALQAGEVDFITTISPDQIESVDATEGIRVETVPVLNYMNIWFNTNEGFITADPRIRQALSLGIDRQTIVEALWDNRVRVMNDYLLPGEFAYDADRPAFEYNPERAMELLAEAGYNGEVIEFTPPATYYTNGQIVTDVIAEMWTAIGVNVSYQPLDTAAWADRSLAGNNVVTLQSFGTNGDPATNGAVSNWISWPGMYYTPNEEFNTLAAEAASSLDPELRAANYRRIFEILDQDVPFAPLYQSVEFYGMRENISWTSHPEFYIDLRPGMFTIN
jgi:peptide/nickel transport system substrate-binding protein